MLFIKAPQFTYLELLFSRSVGMDPEGMKGNLVDFKVEPDVEQVSQSVSQVSHLIYLFKV